MSTIRLCIFSGLAAAALPFLGLQAQTLTTLYSFAGGADGANPNAALLSSGGSLYGTTLVGGTGGQGTVFKLNPATGTEAVLHSFIPGTDGENPSGSLIARGGALFGTTSGGGGGSNCLSAGCGTVFRVDAATGAEKILYRFAGGSDGGFPFAGVIAYGGALYGTTGDFGGGYGTVFKIDPAAGAETKLHTFTQSDGHQPYAPLTARAGALYGTTEAGGTTGCAQEGCGTVFKIDPATGDESMVYEFASTPDGASPLAGLVAAGGAFYGTTPWGGKADSGTVFKVDIRTGAERVLHSFGGRGGGGGPTSGLIFANGALYGTTSLGGTFNRNCTDAEQSTGCGVIFKVDAKSGVETVLYRFTGTKDGSDPTGGLIYQAGVFYGTTFAGGATGNGTVFSFVP
jgi:uncharacterized repeat protein (TIGR03803 family)